MFHKVVSWLRKHPLAVAFGLLGLAPSAFADGASSLDTAPFDTAVTTLSGDVTTLVGKMAPAIVTLAAITLVIVAVNWLVRKVRGAIGRG